VTPSSESSSLSSSSRLEEDATVVAAVGIEKRARVKVFLKKLLYFYEGKREKRFEDLRSYFGFNKES